jgi:hypothetical protein
VGRLAILALAVVALAGCGGDSDDGTPEASGTTTTTTTQRPPPPAEESYPYTNPIKRKGSSPQRLAGDGRYFGYIRAADAKAQTVSFDIAQFFFGADVQKEAEEDGVVAPGEPVSNDHYERNPEKESESLKVSSKAAVTAGFPAGSLIRYVSPGTRRKCEIGASPMVCTLPLSLDRFFSAVKDLPPEHYGIPVWLTIASGQVVRIDEQYFP